MRYKCMHWKWSNVLVLSVLLMIPVVMCAMEQQEETNVKGFNLMRAFWCNCRNIVNYLMKQQKEVEIDGMNLIFASGCGNKEIVDSLIKTGADVNAVDKYGSTVLMRASGWGHKEIVDSLIKEGAHINTIDKHGWTALMKASWSGRKEVVKSLIKNGANPYIKNKEGNNSFDFAYDKKLKKHIIKMRKEYVIKKYKEYLIDGKNRMENLAASLQKGCDWYKSYWDENKSNHNEHDEQEVKQFYPFPKDIAGVIARARYDISDDEWAQMLRLESEQSSSQ